MNKTKFKFITRMIWTRKGLAAFEKDINDAIADGYVASGVEFSKGWLRTLCMAMLHKDPDKCQCQCPCCIEIHQGSCDCECDCCLAHAHRDGTYPNSHDEDDEE